MAVSQKLVQNCVKVEVDSGGVCSGGVCARLCVVVLVLVVHVCGLCVWGDLWGRTHARTHAHINTRLLGATT